MTLTLICLFLPVIGSATAESGEKASPMLAKIESIPAIHNPERGFFLQSNYFVHNLKFTWDRSKVFPEMWLGKDRLKEFDAENDELSEIQLYFYLTDYVGKDLDKNAFDNMQKVLDDARRRGAKVILRFAYDNTPRATKVKFEDIFRHLDQLKPFIHKNIGLIDMWQIGFVGAWGEGNNTSLNSDWKNRAKLAKRMLAIFQDRQITIRYPRFKKRYSLTEAENRRCGFHNDYFTASEHPLARNNDYTLNTETYKIVAEESPYLKVAGEIPYAQTGKWGLHKIFSVTNTLKALRDHHFSAFDITQNNKLNIAHWKKFKVSPQLLLENKILFENEYFQNAKGEPCARSAYEFIRDHLGYRLYFDFEKTKLTVNGSKLDYEIHLRNTGFSAIHNPRPVYLVFIDKANRVKQIERLNVSPSDWQPYDPQLSSHNALTHKITGTVTHNLKGVHKVGLFLPDPTKLLMKNPQYSIRFANRGIEIWKNRIFLVNIISKVTF